MENYIRFDLKITEYKCPHCQKGYLLLDKDLFFEKQYQQCIDKGTFRINDEEDYDVNFYLGTIAGQLKCNHPDCTEITSFIGETKYYLNYYDDEHDREIEVHEKGIFFKYFIPPINIIELKKEYPKELQKILFESFSLYFSSYSACVNTLRILLEKLCELHGIEQKTKKGGYKKLDEKLDELSFDIEVKDLLKAIKWIGNEGSHSLEVIKKDDLDLTYKFIRKALDEIYPSPTDDEELIALSKEINDNKGLNK
ncbi:DUF4145 domain-containing protein [Aliarcobacter butzleri]|uniref:DUF4145 domain-containing protein n=1 Tax=Aliarcobacter butzleri TaxID=28197 RepID=UPI00263EF111|nr:DUF4145 domain-containing protein [Aliarcobacter butzleri]MDN5081978.1 DUF4145 domain-containing protein [Aliarcobacter butzleri]MDN5084288.1 DUF4145 domain-containing protein [Aliarcobacter butzleri]